MPTATVNAPGSAKYHREGSLFLPLVAMRAPVFPDQTLSIHIYSPDHPGSGLLFIKKAARENAAGIAALFQSGLEKAPAYNST
jgi:hypothetical protein